MAGDGPAAPAKLGTPPSERGSSAPSPLSSLAAWGGALLAAALVILIALRYFRPVFVDDAYIYFRYARNAASGAGLAWNPGEGPLEGFTSLLWVGILVLFSRFLPALETAARYAGLLFGLLALLAAVVLFRRLTEEAEGAPRPRSPFWLPALALAFSPVFTFHAVNGMETALTAFLALVTCLAATVGEERASGPVYLRLAALTLLLALARPDAALLGVAAAVARLLALPQPGNPGFRARLTGAGARTYFGALLALGLAFCAWKALTFGRILPLPMYLKFGGSRPIYRDPHLLFAVWGHFLTMLTYAALPLGLIMVYLTRAERVGWRFTVSLAASTVYGFYFLSVLPIVSPEWRYYFPSVVVWTVLACIAAVKLSEVPALSTRGRAAWLVLAGLLIFCNVGRFNRVREDQAAMYQTYAPMGELGRALEPLAGERPVAAVTEAGQFPYYSRWRIFDVMGLNDAWVATHRFRHPAELREGFWSYCERQYGLPDLFMPLNPECDYALPERNPSILAQYDALELRRLGFRVYVRKQSRLRGSLDRILRDFQ